MKALPFKIPKAEQSSIHLQVDREMYFYDTLHQHPEVQLTYIESSSGTLIHGDYLGQFAEGDIYLIGSNVPHVFRNDDFYYELKKEDSAVSKSIFFNWKSFGNAFIHLPETEEITTFLEHASRGIKITGETLKAVREALLETFESDGITKLTLLFSILDMIRNSKDITYLTAQSSSKRVNEMEGKRLNDIFQFTMANYQRSIRLDEVANIANMSTSAFCRYFKQHTRKTYLDFLNEYRISQACRLLMQEDKSVAQVCYESGFSNLSNFNRKFKGIMSKTPRQFVAEKKSIIG